MFGLNYDFWFWHNIGILLTHYPDKCAKIGPKVYQIKNRAGTVGAKNIQNVMWKY
jgi:hypothetical protein